MRIYRFDRAPEFSTVLKFYAKSGAYPLCHELRPKIESCRNKGSRQNHLSCKNVLTPVNQTAGDVVSNCALTSFLSVCMSYSPVFSSNTCSTRNYFEWDIRRNNIDHDTLSNLPSSVSEEAQLLQQLAGHLKGTTDTWHSLQMGNSLVTNKKKTETTTLLTPRCLFVYGEKHTAPISAMFFLFLGNVPSTQLFWPSMAIIVIIHGSPSFWGHGNGLFGW